VDWILVSVREPDEHAYEKTPGMTTIEKATPYSHWELETPRSMLAKIPR
jgi:hypothetical protein